MHVYLRIFLACVPTQPVKAFGIKRLNIYCLVRTVRPLQRQKRSWGGWVGMGGTLPYGACSVPLYYSDLCTAHSALFLQGFSSLYSGSVLTETIAGEDEYTTKWHLCELEEDRTTYSTGHKSQELKGCRPAQVK